MCALRNKGKYKTRDTRDWGWGTEGEKEEQGEVVKIFSRGYYTDGKGRGDGTQPRAGDRGGENAANAAVKKKKKRRAPAPHRT